MADILTLPSTPAWGLNFILILEFLIIGEKARISAAGGFVDFGRVNGNLALSRAIGDFEFKKSAGLSPEQQIVTAYPDVTVHELSDDDEFLVIACDGTPFFRTISVRRRCSDLLQESGIARLLSP